MSKAIERANELYPNSKTFCGGVASIARDAYIRGCQDRMKELQDSGVRGCAYVLGEKHSYVKESSPDSLDKYLRERFKWGDRVRIIIIKEEEK